MCFHVVVLLHAWSRFAALILVLLCYFTCHSLTSNISLMTAPCTSDFVNDFDYVNPDNPFHTLNNSMTSNIEGFSLLHLNIRSLQKHFDQLTVSFLILHFLKLG